MKREKRSFFHVERRNRRCLLSCSGLASGRCCCCCCCFSSKCDISDDDNDDTGNVRCLLFSAFSIFNLFCSSQFVCTDSLQLFAATVAVVAAADEFSLVDVDILAVVAELLIFMRRDKRNKFLGIENARRTSFFFSLNACVTLAISLLMVEFGLPFEFAAIFVSCRFCCGCCCCFGCWLLIWSFWSSLGIVYKNVRRNGKALTNTLINIHNEHIRIWHKHTSNARAGSGVGTVRKTKTHQNPHWTLGHWQYTNAENTKKKSHWLFVLLFFLLLLFALDFFDDFLIRS